MKIETSKMVAYIGKLVREKWSHIAIDKRLQTIAYNIDIIEPFNIAEYDFELHLTSFERDECIILTKDGDLGIYYINEDDEREPVRISLLNKRIVRKVTIEEIEIPSTGYEDIVELSKLAKNYDHTIIEVKYNEVK